MKLINKDALVVEIDNILDCVDEHWDTDYVIGAKRFADKLQDAIDTFEVKEVDLEEEYHRFLQEEWFNKPGKTISEMMAFTAKHFFELGLKAQKGE